MSKKKKKQTRTISINSKTRHLWMKWNLLNKGDKNKYPKLKEGRWFPKDHSDTVLLLIKGRHKGMDQYRFGCYYPGHHLPKDWSIEGLTGDWKVLAWAYIKDPMKTIKK